MVYPARTMGPLARIAGLTLLASLIAAACTSTGASPTPGAASTTTGEAAAEATASPSAPEATATPEVPDGPTCVIEARHYAGSTGAESWRRDESSPLFSVCPGAATMNAILRGTLDRSLGVFARRAGDVAPSKWPSTITITFTIAYSTPELLSTRIVLVEDLSGARPATYYIGLNFQVSDGLTIPLESLFTDTADGLIALSTRSRALVSAQLGADADPTSIYAGTGPKLANFEKAWAFTTDGLEITFQEQQLGPLEIGAPVVVIPWSDLADVISPSGPAGSFVS